MKTGSQPVPARRGDTTPNVAVNDAKASKGAKVPRGRKVAAEGNDPSLVHGPTVVRKVPPEGKSGD